MLQFDANAHAHAHANVDATVNEALEVVQKRRLQAVINALKLIKLLSSSIKPRLHLRQRLHQIP